MSEPKLNLEVTNAREYAEAHGITYEEALDELREDEVWQLLQPVPQKGVSRRFLHVAPGKNWQADLVDVRRNSRDPSIVAYLLVLIDQGSRRAAVAMLQTKTSEEVSRELIKLFRSAGMPVLANEDPTVLTDAGTEFISKRTLERLKGIGVRLIETESKQKAAIVERFIGTLRRLQMISGLNQYRSTDAPVDYLELIPKSVEAYNNRKHFYFRNKLSPNEAVANPDLALQYARAKNDRPYPTSEPKFAVGDWVRVLRWRRMFEKSDDQSRWTMPMEIVEVRELDGVWCYRTRLPTKHISEDYIYEHDIVKVPRLGGGIVVCRCGCGETFHVAKNNDGDE
jgi:transposase InsO family protein